MPLAGWPTTSARYATGITPMGTNELRELLEQVHAGSLSVESALAHLNGPSVAELGYAHVDLHRRERCGFPEVIFCEGKSCEWVEGVVRQLAQGGQDCLATRVNEVMAAHLARQFPQAEQDRVGRTFWLPAAESKTPQGTVTIITAGTSDLPVA